MVYAAFTVVNNSAGNHCTVSMTAGFLRCFMRG
jgi:hypothetical protein